MTIIDDTSKRLNHFIMSVVFVVLLPLVPLVIELWHTGSLSARSLTISAAIYAVTTGATCGLAVMGISIMVSLLFSVAFGVVLANPASELAHCENLAMFTIIAMGLVRAGNRWSRHYYSGQPFVEY